MKRNMTGRKYGLNIAYHKNQYVFIDMCLSIGDQRRAV